MTSAATAAHPTAEDEVVGLCHDLIRIESVNYGDGSGPGERSAAEYVATLLSEVGLDAQVYEAAPGRASVVARISGEDPTRDALVVHGHLDVVPAQAQDWSVAPFSGEVQDGFVWGRGAIDMKDMDAMILSVVRQRLREGRLPKRDVVLAFFADEEAGGHAGAHWLVEHHPDLFEGASEAIGEVGGFSLSVAPDRRLYLVETAEKGIAWMKLTAAGRAGHGSMVNDDNAVTALCEAIARLGRHTFPVRVTKTVRTFLGEISEVLGIELDPDDMDATVAKLGPLASLIGATLRNTVNPTMLQAGYKHNVIPGEASAFIDGRFLPGFEDEFFATIDELIGPDVTPRVRRPRRGSRDRLRRRPRRRDVRVPAGRGSRCTCGALHALRWDGRKVVEPARDSLLRVLPAAPAGGTRLRRNVPRGRRASPRGRVAIRDPGARPVPRPRLTAVRPYGPAG